MRYFMCFFGLSLHSLASCYSKVLAMQRAESVYRIVIMNNMGEIYIRFVSGNAPGANVNIVCAAFKSLRFSF